MFPRPHQKALSLNTNLSTPIQENSKDPMLSFNPNAYETLKSLLSPTINEGDLFAPIYSPLTPVAPEKPVTPVPTSSSAVQIPFLETLTTPTTPVASTSTPASPEVTLKLPPQVVSKFRNIQKATSLAAQNHEAARG